MTNDEETIARFSFFKDEVRADGSPRPKLFEPDKQLECSVFRTDGLKAKEVQRIGDEVVSPNYGKLPYGHCDLFVAQVRKEAMMSIEADEPPDHHAAIRGYAADKSAWKLQAAKLSQQANKLTRFERQV